MFWLGFLAGAMTGTALMTLIMGVFIGGKNDK